MKLVILVLVVQFARFCTILSFFTIFMIAQFSGGPDTSVALLDLHLTRGRVYVEFDINRKGDELLIGVTPHPLRVRTTSS